MQKFVVKKGKTGYDWATIADSEAEAKDLAWHQIAGAASESGREGRIILAGPFRWWQDKVDQWDKWYVVKLTVDIATAPVEPKQEHDVIMQAITGDSGL